MRLRRAHATHRMPEKDEGTSVPNRCTTRTHALGRAVAFAGDVDGDGLEDVAVGLEWVENASIPSVRRYNGVVYVFGRCSETPVASP